MISKATELLTSITIHLFGEPTDKLTSSSITAAKLVESMEWYVRLGHNLTEERITIIIIIIVIRFAKFIRESASITDPM